MRADLGSAIDDPLFYAFNQKGKATELLSLIHMEDFQTENTVNVGAIVALKGNIATTTKPTIGFSDFIGVGGEANEAAPVKQKVCVQEFNDLFARVYELNRENSNLTENSVKSLKDYQNLLLTDIDFDHKKEQPLLEALSGLVDCLIILPQFFKAAIGYDPITDEDLTDQECQDLVITGCFQTVLLGAGAGAGLMAGSAEKAAAKAVAVEAGAVAGDEVLIKSGVVMGDAVAGEAVAGDGLLIGEEGAAAEDLCIEGGTGSLGIVESRINIANDPTRFSPSNKAGLEHVLDRHFNPGKNAGQFTISVDELKTILGNKDVIQSPVTVLETSGQYSRTVNVGEVIGTIKPSIPEVGGKPTTWIEIITDSKGNLITTYPCPAPK